MDLWVCEKVSIQKTKRPLEKRINNLLFLLVDIYCFGWLSGVLSSFISARITLNPGHDLILENRQSLELGGDLFAEYAKLGIKSLEPVEVITASC